MEIKPCKDCLYYDDCIKKSVKSFDDYAHLQVNLKNRIYKMFVEGLDCFHGINRDWE